MSVVEAATPTIAFEKSALVFASKESIRLRVEGAGVTADQQYRLDVYSGDTIIYTINTMAFDYVDLQNVYTPEFDWIPAFSSKAIVNAAAATDMGVIPLRVSATLLSDESIGVVNTDRYVVYASFSASIYGADFYDYLRSQKKFLTWRTVRYVTKESPEYLFLFSLPSFPSFDVRLRCFYTDGSSGVRTLQGIANPGNAYAIGAGYNQLGLDASGKEVDYYEIWLESGGATITEVITFYLDTEPYANRRYVIFRNSLGGWDTVLFSGAFEYTNAITSTNAIAHRRGELYLRKEDVNVSRVVSSKTGRYPYSDISYLSAELCGADRVFLVDGVDVTEMVIADGEYAISDDTAKILDLNLTLKPALIGFNLMGVTFTQPTPVEAEEEVTSHNHDSLYYRKAAIDARLNGYALSATVTALAADILSVTNALASKTRMATYYKRSTERPNQPEVRDEGGLSGDWFSSPPMGSAPLWLIYIYLFSQQTNGTYIDSMEGPFLCFEGMPSSGSSSSMAEHATTSEVKAMHVTPEERSAWSSMEERLRDGVDEDGDTLAKLKLLIDGLKLLINGDDINLDSIKELADYIKANRSVIEQISTDKLNVRDVYNALDCTASGKALDARQGKVINDSMATLLTNLSSKLDRALTANSIWVGDSSGKPSEVETIPIVSQALAYDGQLWKEDFEMSVNAGNSTIARMPCILALSTSTAQNRVLPMAAGTGKTILLTSATLVTTSIGGTVGGESITVELCTGADGSGVVANLSYAYSSTPKYYEATFSNKLVSLSSGLFLKISGRTTSTLFNYITVLAQGCYV